MDTAARERCHFWFAAATLVEQPVDSHTMYPHSQNSRSISNEPVVSSTNVKSSFAAGVPTVSFPGRDKQSMKSQLENHDKHLASNYPSSLTLMQPSQRIVPSTYNAENGVTHSPGHVPYPTTAFPHFINATASSLASNQPISTGPATMIPLHTPPNDGGGRGGQGSACESMSESPMNLLPSPLNFPSSANTSVGESSSPKMVHYQSSLNPPLTRQPLQRHTDGSMFEDTSRRARRKRFCRQSSGRSSGLKKALKVRDVTQIFDDDASGATSAPNAWQPQYPMTDHYIGSSSPDLERISPSAPQNTTKWKLPHKTAQQLRPMSIKASIPSTPTRAEPFTSTTQISASTAPDLFTHQTNTWTSDLNLPPTPSTYRSSSSQFTPLSGIGSSSDTSSCCERSLQKVSDFIEGSSSSDATSLHRPTTPRNSLQFVFNPRKPPSPSYVHRPFQVTAMAKNWDRNPYPHTINTEWSTEPCPSSPVSSAGFGYDTQYFHRR